MTPKITRPKSDLLLSVQQVLIFSALLLTITFLQFYFDTKKKQRPLIPLAVIPVQAIKLADLGLHSAASAVFWIYTIQQALYHPDALADLIQSVNKLDPKFSYPYAFGTLILPALGFTEEGLEIAERGLQNADPDWRISYYLGTVYHIYLKDRKNAAFYFDLASKTPNAPDNIRIVASRYGTGENARKQTKEIWASLYETSDDPIVRRSAEDHLTNVEIIEFLEKAISIYKEGFGRYPTNLDELITKQIVKSIPPSPFGITFYTQGDGLILIR